MKLIKLYSTALLFILFSITSSGQSSNVIGKTFKLGKIEVAQNDFSERMNWEDAKKACAALGIGWRLPTKKELNDLYLNKEKIGGFQKESIRGFIGNAYFSSTEEDDGSAWVQFFTDGKQYAGLNNTSIEYQECFVRAVRTF